MVGVEITLFVEVVPIQENNVECYQIYGQAKLQRSVASEEQSQHPSLSAANNYLHNKFAAQISLDFDASYLTGNPQQSCNTVQIPKFVEENGFLPIGLCISIPAFNDKVII